MIPVRRQIVFGVLICFLGVVTPNGDTTKGNTPVIPSADLVCANKLNEQFYVDTRRVLILFTEAFTDWLLDYFTQEVDFLYCDIVISGRDYYSLDDMREKFLQQLTFLPDRETFKNNVQPWLEVAAADECNKQSLEHLDQMYCNLNLYPYEQKEQFRKDQVSHWWQEFGIFISRLSAKKIFEKKTKLSLFCLPYCK